MPRTVVVLWMERAVDGSAPGAHLRGTLSRLREVVGVSVNAVIADTVSVEGTERYTTKAVRILKLTARGMLARHRGQVLIARYHPLLLPTVLFWRVTGGKIILSVQGSLDDTGDAGYTWLRRSTLFYRASTATSKLAHALIAGAPVLQQHIREKMLGRNATLVSIPNGVFVNELAEARTRPRPRDEPYAVFVGNLASWQGIETMSAAVADAAWPDDLPLVVVGDGTEREWVQDRKNIIWLGRLGSAEAATWHAHAYCSLSLKRTDTAVGSHGYWPFKLIESAACGVPMICSDAIGMTEAAEALGHGITVPAQNPHETAIAVQSLWAQPERRQRLAQKGLESSSSLDWTARALDLEQLISSILSDAR